jgi:hypothetical protein
MAVASDVSPALAEVLSVWLYRPRKNLWGRGHKSLRHKKLALGNSSFGFVWLRRFFEAEGPMPAAENSAIHPALAFGQ